MAKRIGDTSRLIVSHVPETEITPTEPSRLSRKGKEVIPPKDRIGAGTGKGGRKNHQGVLNYYSLCVVCTNRIDCGPQYRKEILAQLHGNNFYVC